MILDEVLNKSVRQEIKELDPVVKKVLETKKSRIIDIRYGLLGVDGASSFDPSKAPKLEINDFLQGAGTIAKERDILGYDKFFGNNPYTFGVKKEAIEIFPQHHFSYEKGEKVQLQKTDVTKDEMERLDQFTSKRGD